MTTATPTKDTAVAAGVAAVNRADFAEVLRLINYDGAQTGAISAHEGFLPRTFEGNLTQKIGIKWNRRSYDFVSGNYDMPDRFQLADGQDETVDLWPLVGAFNLGSGGGAHTRRAYTILKATLAKIGLADKVFNDTYEMTWKRTISHTEALGFGWNGNVADGRNGLVDWIAPNQRDCTVVTIPDPERATYVLPKPVTSDIKEAYTLAVAEYDEAHPTRTPAQQTSIDALTNQARPLTTATGW